MGKLYIAYGSNLNVAQMAMRCPTARIYSVGQLNNWELIYRGSMTGSYATIRRKKGSYVPVVVWVIQDRDEINLDRYEGYPSFYFKQNIMADLPFGKKKAMVYIMDTRRMPGKPSESYKQTIRQGYIDNSLNMDIFEDSLRKNQIECAGQHTFRW
ncbi:MAG: gamma-glutamylcyclotransferase [Hespellia sp.]|nr:gamma-glutamylcyclotransferase [Hespellia sp.]